jgi:GLPGLI family protein
MKKILLIPMLCLALFANAQALFHGRVKIEFEKTINVHAYIKDVDEEWYNWIKDRLPKTKLSYYDFTGDSTRSVYKPGRETDDNSRPQFWLVADKNVVYNDYLTGTTVSQKPVFEKTFLMQDSLAKIKWRLTPDTRTIAGFECRKAVGILDDSVAVFAFYTDEIMISGGPEGIHGLPGMILGIGVPRLHTTWFATKVEVFDVNTSAVKPETKGKKVTRAAMMKEIGDVLRQWGSHGGKMIVNFEI